MLELPLNNLATEMFLHKSDDLGTRKSRMIVFFERGFSVYSDDGELIRSEFEPTKRGFTQSKIAKLLDQPDTWERL